MPSNPFHPINEYLNIWIFPVYLSYIYIILVDFKCIIASSFYISTVLCVKVATDSKQDFYSRDPNVHVPTTNRPNFNLYALTLLRFL